MKENLIYWVHKGKAAKGKVLLKLDIAYPANAKARPYPGVVCMDGGAWTVDSRKGVRPIIKKLAENGFVAIGVSYRLAPKHRFPAQIHDVKCAVRWLRAHAKKYNLDKTRIAAMGYSAGGQLACLLGLAEGCKELEGNLGHLNESSSVCAVISTSGVSDLKRLYHSNSIFFKNVCQKCLADFLGGDPKKAKENYRIASPVSYVKGKCVPVLLIHGKKDLIVPFEQSLILEKKLKGVGAKVRLVSYNTGHGIGSGANGGIGKKADAEVVKFLKEQLGP